MLERERLAVGLVGQHHVVVVHHREREVGGVALLAVADHVLRPRAAGASAARSRGRARRGTSCRSATSASRSGCRSARRPTAARGSRPTRARAAPRRRRTSERPGREIGAARHRAGLQHRPLGRRVLARRQARGIDAERARLALGGGAEESHAGTVAQRALALRCGRECHRSPSASTSPPRVRAARSTRTTGSRSCAWRAATRRGCSRTSSRATSTRSRSATASTASR